MTPLEMGVVVIAAMYFVFAIDDIFFDVTFWLGKIFGWWKRPTVTAKELREVSEWRIAIVTPAWKEDDVIARMLLYNLPRLDYQRYDYWIGTYQNDPDTRREVDKVRAIYPNVRKVTTTNDGPTSKADCVNTVLQAIVEHEQRAGLRYDLIVFHDVEDLVHPQELRLLNWYFRNDDVDFVQLPVLSTPPFWYDFVAGTYIDEFAEQYTKNMFVREKVWGFVPSAGVATCVRRTVIDQLMDERNGTPFAINSLTEDYDLGLGLTVQGRPTRYLHQYVQIDEDDKDSAELIATWAPFPQTFRTAVRQRTRWMAGIVFQGWEHWGWPKGLGWLLAHDRRGPAGYLVVLAGYLLLLYFVAYEWVRVFYDRSLPSVLEEPWFAWLFWIGLFFMCNRLIQRAISTGKLYGFGQALLAIFRTPFSNIVNMVATVPDIELSLMTENQSPSAFVARAISALDDTFAQLKPHAVLVQGDTSSACAGAMAATWRSIPVGHVEAGLRSFNFQEPFPEEFHRRVVGVAAQWHFAPTPESRDNLLREGVPMHRIFMTGNTIVDAVKQMDVSRPYENAALDRVPAGRLALVTAHRRENQGESMRDIARAVKRLVSAVPDLQVVLPLHPNPNVRGLFQKELGSVERVQLLEPLSYPDLLKVLHRSTIILSDSGGLQEEAPSVGRPILILRERTERPEVVQVGAGILVGTDPDLIVKEALAILCDPVVYDRMVTVPNPFGDGKASERIVDILESSLCEEVDSPVMSMVL